MCFVLVLCNDRWSEWVNKDKPESGDGDREMMTKNELDTFCADGKITSIECITSDGK